MRARAWLVGAALASLFAACSGGGEGGSPVVPGGSSDSPHAGGAGGAGGSSAGEGGVGGSEPPDAAAEKPPYRASEACPLKSPGAWSSFLAAASADPRWVKTCSDQSDCASLSAFAQQIEAEVLAVFASCEHDLADNPAVAACTDRLRRYAPAWLRQHAVGSYGFVQENPAYFAQQEGGDAPAGMMTPPPALLSALPASDAVIAAARDNGWPYLVHDSGLGGVRTLVLVADPAGRFEQWMVIGLGLGETLPVGSIMSFLAVQKARSDGSPLARPRVHFRDYLLGPGSSGWVTALPPDLDGKCYACHGSGTRALVPLHGGVVASSPVAGEPGFGSPAPAGFGFSRLKALNEKLLGYGPPDWNGTVEPADHGPPLGEKLGCPSCHDGKNRGPVTVSTSEGMLYQKVAQQLSMRSTGHGPVPDDDAIDLLDREATSDPPLSEAEKAALEQARAAHLADYQELVADRLPAWQRWVTAVPCE